MKIENCTIEDAETILSLYQWARELQMEKKMVVWPFFERAFIEKEITEQRQWKLMIDDRIACNWAITFSDLEIWGEKDKNDSIFIHRIATDPRMRGNRYIDKIVAWAKKYARQQEKDFIRLDTLGNNTRLIEHYTSAGFEFLGITRLADTTNLPGHYQQEPDCCRFEMNIG